MVAFVTLFLALTAGTQPMALAVEEPVARVEILLDGRQIAERTEGPWTLQVDFGPLAPHRLEAVGYDAEGREVDRAVQLVNLPRARAETQILLETGPEGRARRARLVWDTVETLDPQRVDLRFDGRPVPVDDPRSPIPLPEYDPEQQHYLVAELVFEGGLRTEAAIGLGGEYGSEVSSELTAVAVRRAPGKPAPDPTDMQGWFLHQGEPIAVRAVEGTDPERGGADYFVVRDPEAFAELREIAAPKARGHSRPDLAGGKSDVLRPRDRGFLVHPVAENRASRGAARALFPVSPALRHEGRGGLSWLLTRVRFRAPEAGPQQVASAAAVAGLQAARGRPRAVVALIHPDSPDVSGHSWDAVRRYLATLRVPLYRWSPVHAKRLPESWDGVESIRWSIELNEAFQRLQRDVDSQLVVWLEGSFLPQEIELSPTARKRVEWVE